MDLETFKSYVLPVKDKLFRFAFRMVQSEEEAQDIVQEAYVRIWNNIEKLREAANPEAWCMTVTKNLALDALRSRKRSEQVELKPDRLKVETGTDPGVTLEANDTMDAIRSIMNELPEKQKEVLHLRDIEGYSYDEISEIMEITLSQVKVNLFRARKKVKEKLLILDNYGMG